MALSDYRVIATDVLTGNPYGTLPVSSATFTEMLSSPGSFEIVLPVKSALTSNVTPEWIAKGRSAIWIERNGTLLFGGIIWTHQLDPDSNYITIAGEGFHSYLRQRFIRDTLIFEDVEQQSIAAQIITYLQSATDGDVGITVPAVFNPTTTRSKTYNDYELTNGGEAIEEMGANDGGFDFRYVPYVDSTGRRRVQFTPVYPLTGNKTPYRFVIGQNCRLGSEQGNGKDMTNQAIVVGGGDTATPPVVVVSSDDRGGWPLLESVDSFTDITDVPSLTAKGKLRVTQNDRPIDLPEIVTDPDGDPPMTAFNVGDTIEVFGVYGLMQVAGEYKVLQKTLTANEEGEDVTTQVAVIETFQIPLPPTVTVPGPDVIGPTFVDNGDGTWTETSGFLIDNGDGTWSAADGLTDNGDGTWTSP